MSGISRQDGERTFRTRFGGQNLAASWVTRMCAAPKQTATPTRMIEYELAIETAPINRRMRATHVVWREGFEV